MSTIISIIRIILKYSTSILKNEISKQRKMQFEYTTYVNRSHFTLQYYTFHTNPIITNTGKYSKHITISGQLRNIYGPAVTTYYQDGTISRITDYIDGKRHNEHGPAITDYYPNGTISHIEYWKDGYRIDKL